MVKEYPNIFIWNPKRNLKGERTQQVLKITGCKIQKEIFCISKQANPWDLLYPRHCFSYKLNLLVSFLPSANSKLISHRSFLSFLFSQQNHTLVTDIECLQFGYSTKPWVAIRCQVHLPATHWSTTSVSMLGNIRNISSVPWS